MTSMNIPVSNGRSLSPSTDPSPQTPSPNGPPRNLQTPINIINTPPPPAPRLATRQLVVILPENRSSPSPGPTSPMPQPRLLVPNLRPLSAPPRIRTPHSR